MRSLVLSYMHELINSALNKPGHNNPIET